MSAAATYTAFKTTGKVLTLPEGELDTQPAELVQSNPSLDNEVNGKTTNVEYCLFKTCGGSLHNMCEPDWRTRAFHLKCAEKMFDHSSFRKLTKSI